MKHRHSSVLSALLLLSAACATTPQGTDTTGGDVSVDAHDVSVDAPDVPADAPDVPVDAPDVSVDAHDVSVDAPDVPGDTSGPLDTAVQGDTTPPDPAPDFTQSPSTVRVWGVTQASTMTLLTAEFVLTAHIDRYKTEFEAGTCRFRTPVNAFCDPPCGAEQVCGPGGICAPYPLNQDAGTLTLASSGGSQVEIQLNDVNAYFHYDDQKGIGADEMITVSASGAVFPAFNVTAKNVEPLVMTTPTSITFDGSKAVSLKWSNPDPTARIRFRVYADKAAHGLTFTATIECDLPDIGELTVPQSMMSALAKPDYWGCGECPPMELQRYRKVSAPGDHPVDLWVHSTNDGFWTPSF